MGKLILSLVVFIVILVSGVNSTLQTLFNVYTRSADSRETAKLCLIRQAPVRMFQGLILEYSRRTNDTTIYRDQISFIEMASRGLYESLTEVTKWRDAIQITINALSASNEQLKQVVAENPGKWEPEFPSLQGIWSKNVKDRIHEIYGDMTLCYEQTLPCSFMDISCHLKWFFGDED